MAEGGVGIQRAMDGETVFPASTSVVLNQMARLNHLAIAEPRLSWMEPDMRCLANGLLQAARYTVYGAGVLLAEGGGANVSPAALMWDAATCSGVFPPYGGEASPTLG